MPQFELKYKLALSTLAGNTEVRRIQFNTKKVNPVIDMDPDDNKIYMNEDPIIIRPQGTFVDIFVLVASTNPSMTYTLSVWIDDEEITKDEPLKPEYDNSGVGIIDTRINF